MSLQISASLIIATFLHIRLHFSTILNTYIICTHFPPCSGSVENKKGSDLVLLLVSSGSNSVNPLLELDALFPPLIHTLVSGTLKSGCVTLGYSLSF